MQHRDEIESIFAQVKGWPMEDRVALAYEILRDMRHKTRDDAPRFTAHTALGLAKTDASAPDDATVKQWIAERRVERFG